MNTARIVIPTIALSAGGLAAYPAIGLGDKPLPPEAAGSEHQPAKPGETIKLVRYGVSSPTTIQK